MNAKNLTVVLEKNPGDTNKCKANQTFVAASGDTVDFSFPDATDAVITFDGDSPFNLLSFKVGPQKVRKMTSTQSFGYTVRWSSNGGGVGNGGGEGHP